MQAGRLMLLLGVLAAATPVAVPPPSAEDLDANRRLLDKWRRDADHYARLKRDLKTFQALPPDRQAALRRLDRDLRAEDAATQARLWGVLDRYAAWLDRLDEADRRRVTAAPDAAARLTAIKQIREAQWVKRLPEAKQKQLADAPPDRKPLLLAQFRKEEEQRRRDWNKALDTPERPLRPRLLRRADLPFDVRRFVAEALVPVLSEEEKARLDRAEGKWPAFPRTLVDYLVKYTGPLPGPVTGPSTIKDLPAEVRRQLNKVPPGAPPRQALRRFEGKWPDFAVAVTEAIRSRGQEMAQELGPCRPDEFAPAVRQFLETKLLPDLNAAEKTRLRKAEGRWPDYPQTILALAEQHGLHVPGVAPPAVREFVERVRFTMTGRPNDMLRDFALRELKLARGGLTE